MKDLFKMLHYLRPYKGLAWMNVISNILTTIFTILSLLVVKPFLDILFLETAPEPVTKDSGFISSIIEQFNLYLRQYIESNGKQAGLLFVCGIVVLMFFLKNLFRYLALFVMAPVRNGIERDIRTAVFDKLLHLPLSYFSDERKGDLMSRITNDVKEIQWSVLRSIETLVRSPIAIIGSLAVMLYISPFLTLFSFILILFVGLIIGRIGKTLRKKSSLAQASSGNILSILDEALGGIRIVQAFGAEQYQRDKFGDENQYYYTISNKMMRRKDLSSPLTEFLGVSVVVVLLFFGGHQVFNGYFEASTFVTFVLMFYNLIDPAKSFSSAFYDIQKGSAAASRIQEILSTSNNIQDIDHPISIKALKNTIKFQQVSFYYEEDTPILKRINLEIKKGKTVALVGASGAGKSTLIDLVARFYDPTDGQILIDNIDIRQYKLNDLRHLMGMVSQEAILFNDTIYNNIVFGLEGVTKEQVVAAAKVAYAHEFIMETENGYETPIGDRGTKLSGGQRQRLTLARAILRNPDILILDEATSALDSESEKWIQKALENVLQERTGIIIAHRLSTIQNADEIIVMQEGEIVERGTHQSLIEQNGVYKKLVELQNIGA